MAGPDRLSDGFLSTQEAADLCSVDRRTLLRWIDRGLIRSHRPGGGRHRILKSELRRFLREHSMPLPKELIEVARVAVVDDDPLFVRALRRLITRHVAGVEIETASDGFAAGVLVASFRPHVLFLDIVMPGISGVEVCRQVSGNPALTGTSIVIVSGNLTTATEAELLSIGAKRCVPKPLSVDDLGVVLDDFLTGGAPP